MIDWFPGAGPAGDEHGRLARWQAVLAVRRLARGLETGVRLTGHADRVATLAADLAAALGWPAADVEALHGAALVHDVGLACAPASDLAAPGAGHHAEVGARIASAALGPAPVGWIRHHHERWDGRGLPDGLSGEAIPAGAALIALADAYDAMCPGSWDRTLTPDEALAWCEAERGRRFAPWAVDALERVVRARSAATAPAPAPLQLVAL